MKAKTFKDIYIPDPCHENWNKMTPMEKGRFCHSCQKKVYDFRNSTIEEIKSIYKQSKGDACGTFYDDQINQDLKYLANSRPSLIQRLKFSAAAIVAAIWLKILAANDSYGQGPLNAVQDSIEVNFLNTSKGAEKILYGKLINKTSSEGIGNVKINLKNKENIIIAATMTDYEGKFEIQVKEKDLSEALMVVSERQKVDRYSQKIITPSVSAKINTNSTAAIILEAEPVVRKKLFRKKRRVVAGRYRM